MGDFDSTNCEITTFEVENNVFGGLQTMGSSNLGRFFAS